MSAPFITTVADYNGEAAVSVWATQLGPEYSRSQATKIVAEWCDFFESGPSPIRELSFVSRTPKRLFNSLAPQTQLELLDVKWGDFQDLEVLRGMRGLRRLVLAGASSVEALEPLGDLGSLETLTIESLRLVHDLSPLARLTNVVELTAGGDWASPRTVHVDSISFLRQMTQLRRLVLHTMIVDDGDYSPLLALPDLKDLRVARARRMSPTWEELAAAIPALH